MEKDITNLQQYIRRNNVEIVGIPENVDSEQLESITIHIAESIGVKIDHNDIEACHRLKKRKNEETARTIVRFANRKFCEKLHRNKKKLKNVKDKLQSIGLNKNIYINSNLCPYHRYLWGKCKKLFEGKLIHRFWTFNGSIFIALEEGGYSEKIDHLSSLQDIFPDFNFDQ